MKKRHLVLVGALMCFCATEKATEKVQGRAQVDSSVVQPEMGPQAGADTGVAGAAGGEFERVTVDIGDSSAIAALLGAVDDASFPLTLTDSMFSAIDSQSVLTEAQEKMLRLQDLAGYQSNYRYVPMATYTTDSGSIAAVVLYDYPEEWGAYLLLYSPDGILRDYLPIFYDNAGGHSFTSSTILDRNRVAVREVPFDAYDPATEPQIDTFAVENGMFVEQRPDSQTVTITIGSHDISATVPRGHRRAYDIMHALGDVWPDSVNLLSDADVLRAVWPDAGEEYRHDTANGLSFVYTATDFNDSLAAFSLVYAGGCDELWFFTVDTRTNRIRGRFPLSMTCASDADDYSSGLFLSYREYELTSTWFQEYAEEGEDPDKMKVVRYLIGDDGRVNEQVVYEP